MSLAYQVTGDGPLDLVVPSGLSFPIDLMWEDPGLVRVAKRLGSFSRTVWCERRGMGASGGDVLDGFVEEIVDADLTAVPDIAGCERVVLVGASHGGATAIRYAVTHPEQIEALVLISTYAYYIRENGYPWGVSIDALARRAAPMKEWWGTGESLDVLAPSKMGDDAFRAWWARCQRLGVAPDRIALVSGACFRQDVRRLPCTLSVPTPVMHRGGDRYIRGGAGRYLAEHIPGAKYVELPGDDHLFFVGDTDALLDEVEEFLTGSHPSPEGDVVTTTIVFTDIVALTEQSARMGHRKWSTLIDDHDAMVRATLHRHRGREIKSMGDGFLATFDAITRAVRAAREIVVAARGMGLDVRAGVHVGEVEVRPDDVVGLTVNIAKRICDLAGPREVFVSEAVKALIVGSEIATVEEGTRVLRGVPGEWRVLAVGSQ